MRRLVVLGGGTAGTMAANKLRRRLPVAEWTITVVDQDDEHLYQPGLLLLPFGGYEPADLVRPRERFLADDVQLVLAGIDRVDADEKTVHLDDDSSLTYDYLVIATGTSPHPEQTPGMAEGMRTGHVHEFFTLAGATRLRDALHGFDGGRLVVHTTEMPIKCPVAPLEFAFLADDYFTRRGMRRRREHRPPRAEAGVDGRTGGPLRSAGHRPAEHGGRLRGPLGARRRPQLRARRQAHPAVQAARRLRPR